MFRWLKRQMTSIYAFLHDHFAWMEAQGQVFHTEDAVHVQWTESCSSVVEKSKNPRLFDKLRDVPHGSVVFCERIWSVDGFLVNIRDMQVILSPEDMLRYSKTGVVEYKPFLRDSVAAYFRRLKLFDLVNPPPTPGK